MGKQPRVFISYARKGAGEAFARALRQRIEQEEPEITLWQDRAQMEGGVGWWHQITEALDGVQFMVLVMTPEAMASSVVRKEWRYARQQGVCVYPVKGVPDDQLRYDLLPAWMSNAHFYDLEHEWETFVNYLKSPCKGARVPFMAPDLPTHTVPREAERNLVLRHMLDAGRENPVATTMALYGAGGFGKTTLATHLCHQDEVITAYFDGILWAALGEKPNILAELTKLYAALTGERPGFVSEEDATLELAKKLADRRFLMVIDDVWNPLHLEPFLRGGDAGTRLITTRLFEVATRAKERATVDEMTPEEAVQVLLADIEAPPDTGPFRTLAHRLGEWPLLLELAAGSLRQRIARGATLKDALAYLNRALDKRGVDAFDRRNAEARHQAITNTLAVSLDQLSEEERDHYHALAIFPEDVDVPLRIVEMLLDLDDFDTEDLVQRLDNFSLLQFDIKAGTLRLHDAIRAYLAERVEQASALHARLADAWASPDDLSDEYAWQWAVYHKAQALRGRASEERHQRTQDLADFVIDPAFQAGYQNRLGDVPGLKQNLEQALACALVDEHPVGPVLVVQSALALANFEAGQERPHSLFELAREGKLQEAERHLALFRPDPEWRQAILLTCAWLAAENHPDKAAALRDRMTNEISEHDPVLSLLLWRVQADTMPDVPPPERHLPGSPDMFVVSQILERLGGTGMTPIEPLVVSGLQQMGDEAPLYLAEQDGPLLVAFAMQDPAQHTQYLDQYIALHAGNAYPYYRNRSLWALMDCVLQGDTSAWVLPQLQRLEAGALTRSPIDFREVLPLALLALRAYQGDAAARQALDAEREQTIGRPLSSERGQGDPWANHLRKLMALAEVYARVLNEQDIAYDLLEEAMQLPFNVHFAGFRARACLTLAEASRVCGQPEDQQHRAVQKARDSAHNIQDAEFCAQMTARINAMQQFWWTAFDVEEAVAAFVEAPRAVRFATLHIVGETYEKRHENINKLALPDAMRQAQTLQEVTQIYHCMRTGSQEATEAVNPELQGLPGDAVLPAGTHVRVPDPDFAPVLAARLAAEVLATNLPSDKRVRLISHLVPHAITNLTALDTILARLVMAALPAETPRLSLVRNTVARAKEKDAPGVVYVFKNLNTPG